MLNDFLLFQFFKIAFQFFKNGFQYLKLFKSTNTIFSQGPVRCPLDALAYALHVVLRAEGPQGVLVGSSHGQALVDVRDLGPE